MGLQALLCLLLVLLPFSSASPLESGTSDKTEEWGYHEVRPGAHMFWWFYYRHEGVLLEQRAGLKTPVILWLQGGPGASGTGFGNFAEIGPLTQDLEPRAATWLQKGHLLFVDNPVGAGFSYVDNSTLLTRTNDEIVQDLLTFIAAFMDDHAALQDNPFFIFCESYGGKMAAEFALALHTASQRGKVRINFQGVALGDSWISPIDYVLAWGPLLKSFSLVDSVQAQAIDKYAQETAKLLAAGDYTNATDWWADTEELVEQYSDNVNFYNLLLHDHEEATALQGTCLPHTAKATLKLLSRHLARYHSSPLNELMNGPIREKLGIIPDNVKWGGQAGDVFAALSADFMLPVTGKVDALLLAGVQVTVYSGQLDLICCSTGTEAWLQRLRWPGLPAWNAATRTALYVPSSTETAGFVKASENLAFYWIMMAGHMVPADAPEMALKMVDIVTSTLANSPLVSSSK